MDTALLLLNVERSVSEILLENESVTSASFDSCCSMLIVYAIELRLLSNY